MTLPDPPLLLVTDRRQATMPLHDVVASAFAAGWRWASVREKDLGVGEQVALAQNLKTIARHYDARLTLHGDADVARAAGLDGVHLPAGANAISARAVLGPSALIGISVHGVEEAARLEPRVVDYCCVGPVAATSSKPGYGPALGWRGIAAIAAVTSVPVIAIGGIDERALAGLPNAGISGIAVMGGIIRASDPGSAARALWRAFTATRPVR